MNQGITVGMFHILTSEATMSAELYFGSSMSNSSRWSSRSLLEQFFENCGIPMLSEKYECHNVSSDFVHGFVVSSLRWCWFQFHFVMSRHGPNVIKWWMECQMFLKCIFKWNFKFHKMNPRLRNDIWCWFTTAVNVLYLYFSLPFNVVQVVIVFSIDYSLIGA